MVRTVGSNGPKTHEAIMVEGLRLIYEHGYDALTIRQLATAVGLTQGAIYNHIRSKQDLLFVLVRDHMIGRIANLEVTLANKDDPLERVIAFIEFHLTYNVTRRKDVFIGSSELRSLERPNRAIVLELRQRYQNMFVDIIDGANKAGAISVQDVKVTAYAILAMLTGVCDWYTPTKGLPFEKLVELHTQLVLKGLCASAQP